MQLKYNRDENNEDWVFKKWSETAINRCQWLKNDKINTADILNEWPAYSQSYGPKLLDIDFRTLYPNAFNIYLIFEQFCSDVFPIMENKIVESSSKLLIKEYKQQKNISLSK